MSSKLIALLQAAVFALIAISAWGQSQASSADLKGSIFDPSRATVPGATVTASNINTGVSRSTVSDSTGGYRIALLQPGEYEVRVEAAGFAAQRHRGIILTVGQTAVID